jgi:5-hydroxyisourate hydrolase-like protein (transthyretin family)
MAPGATLGRVPPTALTRRRALAIGAAAGTGLLLRPRLPSAHARAPRGFSMDVAPSDFGRVLAAPRRFQIIGAHANGVEVRTRPRGGPWGTWVPLRASGAHGPDHPKHDRSSDPVWVGDADELQLRGRHRALRLQFVAVPAAARRRHVSARSAQIAGAPAMITRDQWGPGFTARVAPSYGEVQMAFVHHTVNANDYAPQDSAGIVLGIAKYHRDHNGWNDIGYNFLVDKYGQIFEGRGGGIDQPVIGAQAEGWNRLSTGVANIGTFSAVTQTPEAVDAIARLLGWKMTLHGIPCEGTVVVTSGGGSTNRYAYGTQVTMQRISGHRDGCNTECPGNALYAQLPDIRAKSAAHAGAVPAATLRLTCVPAATAVDFGRDAVFTGTAVNGDGSPAAALKVSLQKVGRSGTWVTVEHATTASDGSWSVRYPWIRTGRVRARVDAVVSPSVVIEVVPLLQASSKATRVRAGGVVALSGSVRPAAAVRVLVERKDRRGRWRRVTEVRAKVRKQRFSASLRLRQAGLYRLTARTGTAARPVAAPALYVRAVRRAKDVPPPSGGTPAG